MKKNITLIVLSLFLLAGLIKPTESYGQITSSDDINSESIVYWFDINFRIVTDTKTKLKSYSVRRTSNQIKAATIIEYDEKLWEALSRGGLFPVGPFSNYDEADQAKVYYNIGKEEKQDSLFEAGRTVYWFVLRVKRRKRSNSWELIRIPGAIASGDYDLFQTFLETNLSANVLTIGPFWNQPEAEEAKRRYRLH